MTIPLKSGSTVVFIGDSITDCGRDREDRDSLGNGFVSLAAARFTATRPHTPVRFVNRGISGDRAIDLRERWSRDCLALKPDVVSVLVGINDVWRRFDSNDPTPAEVFENHYRHVLEQTAQHGARLIMMEPFLLPVTEDQQQWQQDLGEKSAVVRVLAKEFAATLIPTQRLMSEAADSTSTPSALAADGVHPTPAAYPGLAGDGGDAVRRRRQRRGIPPTRLTATRVDEPRDHE
ncbi:SGNH/GDSL hydrolase family protein [Streptomyces sp. NPDC001732]